MAAKKHTSVDGVRFVKAPRTEAAERTGSLNETVAGILRDVREGGDEAVRRFGKAFDKVDLDGFEVGSPAREAAVAALDPQTRADTEFAIERVRAFAEAQLATILPLEVEALPGLHLGHRVIPIERVGGYVPGGRYPLLSAPVMTIVPAKVAGCDEVIACLPPDAHQAMIAGCHLSGADRIFRIGGAQAIAAMAYGTETRARRRQDRRPGQRLRERGQAPGLRAGRHRPARRAERDLRRRRRNRRRRDDRHRPPGPGRARRAHPRRPDHHRSGARRGDARRTSSASFSDLPTAAVAGAAWENYGEIVLCEDEADDDRLLRRRRGRAPAGPHARPACDGGEAAQLRLAVHRAARQRGLFGQVLRHQPHAADHGGRAATPAGSGSAPTSRSARINGSTSAASRPSRPPRSARAPARAWRDTAAPRPCGWRGRPKRLVKGVLGGRRPVAAVRLGPPSPRA